MSTILLLYEFSVGILKKPSLYHVWKPNGLVLYLATLFKRAQTINETRFETVSPQTKNLNTNAVPTEQQSHLAANPINRAETASELLQYTRIPLKL